MNTSIVPEPSEPSPPLGILSVSSGHKRNGKVARLPKGVRDKINQWLDDGHTYPQIIKDLGEDAKDLKPGHLSEWRKGGYQDYLRHQEWRDQLRILRENGAEMTELTDGPKFQETLVQIALTEIFRVLERGELKPDSLNYIRLFNALARLNREALGLRKYNDHLAKEQAEFQKLDINREISENEHVAIVDRADRIFEMPRPRRAEPSPEPCSSRREEAQTTSHESRITHHESSLPIENQKSKIKNASRPLPSRPCRPESPSPRGEGRGEGDRDVQQPAAHAEPSIAVTDISPIENKSSRTSLLSKIENTPPTAPESQPSEHCLDCGSLLPPVPPDARRRPGDHCPSCGMRLPDIGLCSQPGFDHCLTCGATQPALLPDGERPRPNCHKCGERLHNPELPNT